MRRLFNRYIACRLLGRHDYATRAGIRLYCCRRCGRIDPRLRTVEPSDLEQTLLDIDKKQ